MITGDELRRSASVYIALLATACAVSVFFADQLASALRYDVNEIVIENDLDGEEFAIDMIQDSLANQHLFDGPVSIFNPDLLLMVQQAYEGNPWVRDVVAVRRKFPGTVLIELRIRRPFVSVDHHGRYRVADDEGEFLPFEIDRPLPGTVLLTMRGEGRGVLDERGYDQQWYREAVQEGIAVVDEIWSYADSPVFDHVGIDAVDLSNFQGRLSRQNSEVVLLTDEKWLDSNGVRRPVSINWGRSAWHFMGSLERPVAGKFRHLETVIAERGGLGGFKMVDVRYDRVLGRFPDNHLSGN